MHPAQPRFAQLCGVHNKGVVQEDGDMSTWEEGQAGSGAGEEGQTGG